MAAEQLPTAVLPSSLARRALSDLGRHESPPISPLGRLSGSQQVPNVPLKPFVFNIFQRLSGFRILQIFHL